MNWFRQVTLWAGVLAWLAAGVGCAYAAEKDVTPGIDAKPGKEETMASLVQNIPLDKIWAYDMPGTRPINQATVGGRPLYGTADGPLLSEIQTVLTGDRKRPDAGKGFAVAGEGLEALREAHVVLVKGKAKIKKFRKGEEISLVFYSREFGYYVHLVGAEQRGNTIQVTYRFVPHLTLELTHHFALIPVTITKVGAMRVEVKPQFDSASNASKFRPCTQKIVCQSFGFDVLEEWHLFIHCRAGCPLWNGACQNLSERKMNMKRNQQISVARTFLLLVLFTSHLALADGPSTAATGINSQGLGLTGSGIAIG